MADILKIEKSFNENNLYSILNWPAKNQAGIEKNSMIFGIQKEPESLVPHTMQPAAILRDRRIILANMAITETRKGERNRSLSVFSAI